MFFVDIPEDAEPKPMHEHIRHNKKRKFTLDLYEPGYDAPQPSFREGVVVSHGRSVPDSDNQN